MATGKYPNLKFFRNDVDITTTVKNYIISLTFSDIFDNNFTLSQLKIEVSSYLDYVWEYRDKIRLELYWSTSPSLLLNTGNFYIDYLVDNRRPSTFSYEINATEANLDQGFTIGEPITYTNTNIDTALTNFANLYGLTLIKSVDNAILGTVDIPDPYGGGALPGANSIEIEFNSYADMLRHISQNYGYFGNLSGTTLQMIKPESLTSFESEFGLPDLKYVFDFRGEFKYTGMAKTYRINYADDSTDNLTIGDLDNNLPIVANQIRIIDPGKAHANVASATARASGELRNDFIDGYRIRLTLLGKHEYTAGAIFFLPISYGVGYTGYYRTVRVVHQLNNNSWTTEIEAFLLNSFDRTTTTFNGYYAPVTGVIDLTISEEISSANPITITAANINDYISEYNPTFITNNPNTGSQVLTRSTNDGIRTDVLMALALVETSNFTFTNVTSKFNPGAIGNAAGTAIHDFGTWDNGWLGTTQHLFAYANATGSPQDAIVDPRYSFVSRGSAPLVSDLDGKWSAQNGFGESIKQYMLSFYQFLGYNPSFS